MRLHKRMAVDRERKVHLQNQLADGCGQAAPCLLLTAQNSHVTQPAC